MSDHKFPSPEELQREFEEFVHQRFGDKVKVVVGDVFTRQPVNGPNPRKLDNNPRGTSKKGKDFVFDFTPKDLKSHLDRFIVGQDDAKKALSIAVCDHFNQIMFDQKNPGDPTNEFYAKQNVLLLGPTGVGKTHMIRQIAKLIGVPFVKADATRFSETGYIGANVEDLIRDLVQQAEDDIGRAQYGMVYLDEADKLATAAPHGGRDVSGRGVQLGLLKLMEETEVDLKSSHDPASQMQAFMELQQKGKVEKQVINTKYILFIVSGAFSGLDEIINKRLKHQTIGFAQSDEELIEEKASLFAQASTQDFISFGFEPEFIGRLPVRVACHDLDVDALKKILKDTEGSILEQYKRAFACYGVTLCFSEDSIDEIARKACHEKTGARGLMTICERALREFKFELPSTALSDLYVTRAMIQNPKKELINILKMAPKYSRDEMKSISVFEEDFFQKHEMRLSVNSEAKSWLCEEANKTRQTPAEICRSLLFGYEHGLKLIRQNTGESEFEITLECLLSPQQFLEQLILESYKNKQPKVESIDPVVGHSQDSDISSDLLN